MKIFCAGRNYADHAKELKNDVPSSPVIFLKPDTALNRSGKFYLPDFSSNVHYETEIVYRISKEGKRIEEKFAPKYYDAIAIGIDFTARDIQDACRKAGLPWELAKGFDGSAPVSDFVLIENIRNENGIDFSLKLDGEERQHGNSADMIFHIDFLVSFISRYYTLKKGDLIFTGTPAGVGQVKQGDMLEAFLFEESVLKIAVL